MKNLLYQSVKISIAVVGAIFIANLFQLTSITTAGIFAMLSLLETRRKSYIVGLKRVGSAILALLLSSLLFTLGGHTLLMLGLFLLIFIPLGVFIKSPEGLSVSTVIVTHIYTLQQINTQIIINEFFLVLIGISTAWLLTLHMPNTEKQIVDLQQKTEALMVRILNNMALQLLGQCSIAEQQLPFTQLSETIEEGYQQALNYHNNLITKNSDYYIHYFTMREEQFRLLSHMEKYFSVPFIAAKQAKPLSDLTKGLALQFHESFDGKKILVEADRLLANYKASPLPTSREEFEHRATLFQYLSDLVSFIEIKYHFIKEHQLQPNIDKTKRRIK